MWRSNSIYARVTANLRNISQPFEKFREIGVSHDLQPKEREENKRLVQEPKQNHIATGNDGVENYKFLVVGRDQNRNHNQNLWPGQSCGTVCHVQFVTWTVYTLLNADTNHTFFSLCFNDWQCSALQVRFCAWRALNSLLLLLLVLLLHLSTKLLVAWTQESWWITFSWTSQRHLTKFHTVDWLWSHHHTGQDFR